MQGACDSDKIKRELLSMEQVGRGQSSSQMAAQNEKVHSKGGKPNLLSNFRKQKQRHTKAV